MSETVSSFLKAAERLDRVARAVKGDQLEATGAPPALADERPVSHPEEAWARRFALHPIRSGKDIEVGAPPLSAFFAPLAQAPAAPSPDEPPVLTSQAPVAPRLEAGGHIGAGLGKAGPRRSWLARLLRGG